MYIAEYTSPLGKITLTSNGNALTGLYFEKQKPKLVDVLPEPDLPVFKKTAKWLDCYFFGNIPDFNPDLEMQGTPFRQMVWDVLKTIPYGETMTYGEIAKQIAEVKGVTRMSAQAVGNAVGNNPVSIIVPCHRVVGANGSLVGYAGGVELKRELLIIEKFEFVNDWKLKI